jgi:uncharacterized membrane protein YdjX (TVP38/TMEM64 family)
MQILNEQDRRRVILAISLLAGIVVLVAILGFMGLLAPLCQGMWEIFRNKEQLRSYIESWGAWAPFVFVSVQALQVVMAPIPGELTGAVGGFIFGTVPSVIYSTVGLTAGSVVAFLAARIIGLPLVKLAVSQPTLEKFHFLTERRGTFIAALLFVIPGFPKDILCYILGLSPMGLVTFSLVCALGRIPGTVMLSYCGCAVYNENWTSLVVVSVVCLALIAFLFMMNGRIELWLHRKRKEAARG